MSSLSLSYSLAFDLSVCDRFRGTVLISMQKFGCLFKPLASAQIQPESFEHAAFLGSLLVPLAFFPISSPGPIVDLVASRHFCSEPRQEGTDAGSQ